MTTTDRQAFLAAIAANPNDLAPRLIYADWLEEQGNDRDGVAALCYRHSAEAASVVESLGDDLSGVYTRESAADADGYNGRVARDLFARKPNLLLVIVTDDAVTSRGLRKTGRKDVPVWYYRKSSGGRYGRSVQSTGVVGGK